MISAFSNASSKEVSNKVKERPMPKSGQADQIRRVTRRFDVPYSAMHGEMWQQTIRLDTAGYELSSLPDARTGMVPQVVGMGLKDALYLLEREGLRVTFTGVGYIQNNRCRQVLQLNAVR